MDTQEVKFTVKILDKEYPIEGNLSENRIRDIQEYIDTKFSELKNSDSMIPLSRLAILACLNIVNELFEQRNEFKDKLSVYEQKIDNVLAMVDKVL